MGLEVLTEISGRPRVVIVGSPNVGKHSLLKRLISNVELLKGDLPSDSTCHGWTINTKYYTADVCVWMVRLEALDSKDSPILEHCEALLMVFDLSNPTTFENLQQWVASSDLSSYEVQICIGNKADRLPSHFGHVEYRRRLMKRGELSGDPHPEFMDFGIDRAEGGSLLAEEEDNDDTELKRRACIEWCTDHGIEYVEACAINEVFDKCISVDGDLQGVPRILDALSAHMWPGLVMKSPVKLTDVVPPVSNENDEEIEFSSDDEEDFLIEYEILSNASTEPWDGNDEMWNYQSAEVVPSTAKTDEAVTAEAPSSSAKTDEAATADAPSSSAKTDEATSTADAPSPSTPLEQTPTTAVFEKPVAKSKKEHGAADLEKMMHEMSSMRENMRNMPDGQRREMAAQLAMRMASMFLDEDEEDDDE